MRVKGQRAIVLNCLERLELVVRGTLLGTFGFGSRFLFFDAKILFIRLFLKK